jgi:DNA-binding response OmpR family regulator
VQPVRAAVAGIIAAVMHEPDRAVPTSRSVLLVDDDPKFRAFVRTGLEDAGISCTVAADAPEILAILADPGAGPFDVVLLDVMMPRMSGFDLLARLRETSVRIPVIFVTAREAVEERVQGLRMGADDYIIKPFAFAELRARIEAVVRRRRDGTSLVLGDLQLDLTRRQVRIGDRRMDLSPREFDLLRLLVDARSRIVSRRELLAEVWGMAADPGTNVVDVHVGRLRHKLALARGPVIRTIRGKGYTLLPEARADQEGPA